MQETPVIIKLAWKLLWRMTLPNDSGTGEAVPSGMDSHCASWPPACHHFSIPVHEVSLHERPKSFMGSARRLRRHPLTRPRLPVVEQDIRHTPHPTIALHIPRFLAPTAPAVLFA